MRRVRRLRLLPISLMGLIGLLLLSVGVVSAHPLDVYLQATYITLAGDNVLVDVDMTPGVLIASEVLPWIDTDGDGAISDAEGAAYLQQVMGYFKLQANGADVPLTLTSFQYPAYVDFSAGTGIIRLHMSAALPQKTAGDYQLTYSNSYQPAPVNSTYLVNGFIQADVQSQLQITGQQRDYYQHTMTLSYRVTAPTTSVSTAAGSSAEAADSSSLQQQLMSYLHEAELSPLLLVVAFGLALVVGGLHALTPGHGKTLIAAYLIGSRGTLKHAVALGGIVTITHTASVIVIGLLALFASQYIVPDLLVPLLEVGAGLLVVLIGAKLVLTRWSSLHYSAVAAHPHLHRLPDSVRFGDLLGMGVSGGIVPCPEALGILLVAIGLGRIPLGLGLIISFSLGLAVVLIGLGVLLVRFKPLMSRFLGEGGRWQRVLPLISAILVTLLGLGLMLEALASGAITSATLIAVAAVVILLACVYELVTHLLDQRSASPAPVLVPAVATAGVGNAAPFVGMTTDLALLPPRYRTGKPVSNAPMGSAALKFDADGQVAWDQMWTDFCDLALAGGPPHRGTLLEPVSPDEVRAKPEAYARVVAEIARGLRLVTGLEVITGASPGWIGLVCTDEAMAIWLLRAILVENVSVRREYATLFFPAGPDFALEGEIKNVITVVAKTNHYWVEHITG